MVLTDIRDILARALEQFARRKRGHEHDVGIGHFHRRNECWKLLEILGIVAADLVADLPVFDAIWLGMSVRGTLCAPRSLCAPVAILDQFAGALRAIGKAEADQRLSAG